MAEPEPGEKQSSERLLQPGFESSQQSFCIVRDKRIESAQRGLWLKKRDEVDIFVGKSKDVQSIIEQVAPSDVTVLIQGESGTGTEMVASRSTRRSRRKEAPFVLCIPAELRRDVHLSPGQTIPKHFTSVPMIVP
jgi:transcriptional regulator with GAF, ATPase, and Fis domain